MRAMPPPFPLAWWVVAGRMMAGCYPGHALEEVARRQLGRLIDAGLLCFVDLMEEAPRGAPPYEPMLRALAAERGVEVERVRLPIEDHGVPGDAELASLEALIAERLRAGTGVYLHCWGGRGRTGVVAGVALLRLGCASPTTLQAAIDALRATCPGPSPETPEQEAFAAAYAARVPAADWPRLPAAEGPGRR